MKRDPARHTNEMSNEAEKATSACSGCFGFPFKVEGSKGWAGNLPCVHGPNEGCSQHNPQKQPIAWNKRIPSDMKKPGLFERLRGKIDIPEYDEIQRSTRIWSQLHLDRSTADPLDPIHKSIHYALAHYHLNWVRTAESLKSQMARASAISCNGTLVGDAKKHRPDFQYWINPYWYNDSFLIQETVKFTIEPKKRNPIFGRESVYVGLSKGDWTFRPCPHVQHHFKEYQFTETRGLMKTSMSFTTKRRNCLGGWFGDYTRWQSIYGPGCTAWNCQYCCTDNWVDINMVEDKIVVHVYAWKDLGSAKDAYDGKWLAALRPKGPRWKRTQDELKKSSVRDTVLAAIDAEKKEKEKKTGPPRMNKRGRR
ncbi:hypothetical protein F5Y13DRAFT_97302 [Hypoxylon sp. FL1857]|nr:hypothetical protein F5Y13DRAFT_97302 [Hypoxylon sp. FL1857]